MDWFKAVLQSRRETVSGYLYAARLKEGVIIYAAPVVSDRNDVIGVLSLAIRLEWLSTIGQEPGLPPDAMVYLLDRGGNVLVGPTAQGVDTQAGLPDAETIKQVVDGHIRTFDSVGHDGIQRNYAVNVIGEKELFVLLGQPIGRLIDPLRMSLMIQIGVLAFVSVAAMAAALIGTRVLVTKWIGRLTEAASSMSVGDLSVRARIRGRAGRVPRSQRDFARNGDPARRARSGPAPVTGAEADDAARDPSSREEQPADRHQPAQPLCPHPARRRREAGLRRRADAHQRARPGAPASL